MKRTLYILFATVPLLVSSQASADSFVAKPYLGIEYGVGSASFNFSGVGTYSSDSTVGNVFLGYAFSKYLGVEGHLGASTTVTKPIANQTYNFDARIRQYESVYLRGSLPFRERWGLYGLVGLSRVQFTSRGGANVTHGSFSYGAGVQFYGSPNTALTLSYVQLYNGTLESGLKVNYTTVSLGLIHYFEWPHIG